MDGGAVAPRRIQPVRTNKKAEIAGHLERADRPLDATRQPTSRISQVLFHVKRRMGVTTERLSGRSWPAPRTRVGRHHAPSVFGFCGPLYVTHGGQQLDTSIGDNFQLPGPGARTQM